MIKKETQSILALMSNTKEHMHLKLILVRFQLGISIIIY